MMNEGKPKETRYLKGKNWIKEFRKVKNINNDAQIKHKQKKSGEGVCIAGH